MAYALDHVVVIVESLAGASGLFRDAGFTVLAGGRHDELPTENALVAFADGAYLELLAMREPGARAELAGSSGTPRWAAHLRGASAVARRFLPRLAGGPGVADLALRSSALDRFAREGRRRGVALAGPVAMSRETPGGERLAWRLALPADDALPFLIEDRSPRARRVPGDAASVTHANGARGVREVVVRTPDVPATALAWADLFGAPPRVRRDGATELALDGFAVVLEPGAPARACAARIAGASGLPEAIEALGVRA